MAVMRYFCVFRTSKPLSKIDWEKVGFLTLAAWKNGRKKKPALKFTSIFCMLLVKGAKRGFFHHKSNLDCLAWLGNMFNGTGCRHSGPGETYCDRKRKYVTYVTTYFCNAEQLAPNKTQVSYATWVENSAVFIERISHGALCSAAAGFGAGLYIFSLAAPPNMHSGN